MVGQIRPSAPQSELRSRLSNMPGSGARYQGIGLVAAAGAIAQGGNALLAGVEQYEAAEKAKRDFRSLTNFVKMTGEFTREAEDMKLGLPPDGSGYENLVTERFRERFEEFSSGLEPDEVEEFNFRGETFQQNVLTQARNFSSTAAEGYALATVDAQVDDLMKSVYENPAMRFAAKQQVADLLARAPISAQMKAERAARAAKLIDGSGLSGTLRENYRRRNRLPFSDESAAAFEALVTVGEGTPDGRNSPKGAAGMAQVMPATAAEIARELGDKKFPANGTEEQIQDYMRSYDREKGREVSTVYGQYYFNKMLKRYNGDVELALIAYNAGPGRADAFKNSGRDWAALPAGVQKETKPYVERVTASLGILQEQDIFTGSYDLSFEQQTAALGALEQQQDLADADAARLAEVKGEENAALLERFNTELAAAEIAVFNDPAKGPAEIKRLHEAIDALGISDAAKEKNKRVIASTLSGAALNADAEEGRLGAGVANPERYYGASLEQRRQASALQERIVAQEVAQLRADQMAEREKQRATLNVAIDGGAGFSVIEDAVKNGVLTAGSSEYDSAVKRFEDVNREAIALQKALGRFNDPNNVYSPTKDDRDELSSIATQLGLPAKLKARDANAIADLLMPMFNDANGVLPENVRQTLFTMAQSPNASEVGYAYKALETLYRKNGGAFVREFAGYESLIQQTEHFASLANSNVPEAAAVAQMVSLRSPEQQKVLRDLQDQADKTLREDFTLDQLRAEFSSTFPTIYGERGSFGENEAQLANSTRIYGSYREAFRNAYVLSGDKDTAHERAMASVNRQFGMFSGALVKYPPQNHVGQIDNSHEWVTRQFERDMRITPGDTYYVVNDDDVSSARVRQGAAPSYMFVVVRKPDVNSASFSENIAGAEAVRWAPSIEAERVYGANLAARTREDPTQDISVIEQNVRLRSQQAGDMLGLMREYIDADPTRRLQIKNTLSAGYAGVDFPQETGPSLELLNRTRQQIERGVEIPETAKFWLRGGSNAGNQ